MIEMKLSGLDGVIETLKGLPPEVASKRGGIARAALRKGALVILAAAKANLARSVANEPRYSTGLLIANLVASRGKAPSTGNGERYLVRVRRKSYPRTGGGKAVTTLAAANLLEYGSEKQQAEPWLRPAFAEKAPEAIQTIERELIKGINRAVRKLAAKNRKR